MAVSNAVASALLQGILGDEKIAGAPATLYFGVSSTEPTLDAGVITGATEPTTGGYARVAVDNDDTEFSFSGRTATNVNAISFPEATADWDEIVEWFFVADASTAGNILFAGALNKAFTIYEGVTLTLAAEAATLTVLED